jgi:hypothetical protein
MKLSYFLVSTFPVSKKTTYNNFAYKIVSGFYFFTKPLTK